MLWGLIVRAVNVAREWVRFVVDGDAEPVAWPAATPTPAPREFGRILEPVDPWLDEGAQINQVEGFRGKYETISVFHAGICPGELALASFYGSASYQLPVEPSYLRFDEHETKADGAALTQTDSDPPWPEEYRCAHHDLSGALDDVARNMVQRYTADSSRRVTVERFKVLDALCALLGRVDVHEKIRKRGQKQIRRLLGNDVERAEIWVPLAKKHAHLLDDTDAQKSLRALHKNQNDEWDRVANELPRLRTDQRFKTT